MIKIIILISLLSSIVSFPANDLNIYSDNDCWMNDNHTLTKKYAILVNFSQKFNDGKESCSVHIMNPWPLDMQNGFGIFLPQPMDCSATVTIECLPGSTLVKQTTPSSVQYTCYSNSSAIEMPCNLIGLTFKRNIDSHGSKYSTSVQVTALAKEPCVDRDILFQCSRDYPHSCIDRKLQCNGHSECPSADDERDCYQRRPAYIPFGVIALLVLGFLFVICVVPTLIIYCCCRVACHAIIRRFHPSKKANLFQKGETAVATGEDAGLMRGLTTPSVIEALPQRHTEPTTLMIDSTKPIYPRL